MTLIKVLRCVCDDLFLVSAVTTFGYDVAIALDSQSIPVHLMQEFMDLNEKVFCEVVDWKREGF